MRGISRPMADADSQRTFLLALQDLPPALSGPPLGGRGPSVGPRGARKAEAESHRGAVLFVAACVVTALVTLLASDVLA